MCSLSEAKDAIKPNIKSERTTIILREIPSATPPAEVEAVFADCGHAVASVRSDVGDTWFVTMASEQDAVATLLALRSKTFRGAAIKARLKSENLLKSFYPTQPAENTITPAIGTPYGGRGYFGNGGYYDVPNTYGVQYMNGRGGQHHHQGPHYGGHQQGAPSSSRGGGRSGGPFRGNRSGNSANASAAAPAAREARGKGGNSAESRPSARKSKSEKRAAKASAAGDKKEQPAAANGAHAHAHGKKGDRQPILSAANFPPLPTVAPGDKPAAAAAIAHSYAHEDIMEIVKNMDDDDCKLREGKMDFAAHPAALTPVAHPDLLRNQRTYSIEQAREAMRQGRPIRSDSVGSIDYESLMYGEDYTKEAREQRQQQQQAPATSTSTAATATPAAQSKPAAPASTPSAASTTKVVGYAAAVIHGTPAPAPVLEPKKKQPAKAAAPATSSSAAAGKAKEEKKGAKKHAKPAGTAPAVDESLPKAGAWGGRNFLDVVKSEPPAAPAKVEPKKPADKSESK